MTLSQNIDRLKTYDFHKTRRSLTSCVIFFYFRKWKMSLQENDAVLIILNSESGNFFEKSMLWNSHSSNL